MQDMLKDKEALLLFDIMYRGTRFRFGVQDGMYSPEKLVEIMNEALRAAVAELRAKAQKSAYCLEDDAVLQLFGCSMREAGDGWMINIPQDSPISGTNGALKLIKGAASQGIVSAQRALELYADRDDAAVYAAIADRVSEEHDIYPLRIEGGVLDVGNDNKEFFADIEERVRLLVCEEEPVSMEPDWLGYKEHGYATCPSCGSDKIATQDTERYGDTELRVHKTCPNCSFSWDDIYDLTCSKSDNGWESDNYGGM